MGKPPATQKPANPEPREQKPPVTLEGEIERQIGPLIPQQQRGQVIQRITAIVASEQFAGPIAHPRHLKEYEAILPGSAERIVAMAEKQQNHNISMETKIVDSQVADQQLGMWFGFIALLIDLGLAFWAGMSGNNILAGILVGAGVLSVILAFVKGRFSS